MSDSSSQPEALTPTELALAAALKHQQAGHFSRAEQTYRKILKNEPENLDAMFRLASLALQFRQFEAATELMHQCITLDPQFAQAHYGLGRALLASGKADLAVPPLIRSAELSPDASDVQLALGQARLGCGDLVGAIDAFEKACEMKPDAVAGRFDLGRALRSARRFDEAAHVFWEAAILAPEQLSLWEELAACFPAENIVGQAAGLAGYCDGLQSLDSFDFAALSTAVANWAERNSLAQSIKKLLDQTSGNTGDIPVEMTLLTGMLSDAPVADLEVEEIMVALRAALLQRAAKESTAGIDAGSMAMACALAIQCFLNEYLYDESAAETKLLQPLLKKADKQPGDLKPLEIAVLGAYRPLLECAIGLSDIQLGEGTMDASMASLLRVQIAEPLREREIMAQLPRLTDIDDAVSTRVREQYEENPYPRWSNRDFGYPATVERVLTGLFPYLGQRDIAWPAGPRILIAGCGSGRHPIATASRFENSSLLAIDLSLPSLAFAFRRAAEYGLYSIYFAQADILKLGEFDKRFEIIEAVGVLHHLENPEQGLAILKGLLVPGGFMRLAFYSELGRRGVVAARALAEELEFEPDKEGIRACRKALIELDADHPAKAVLSSPDFFTVSGMRDFVFHTQEHRFTLPQLARLLDNYELEFLGFELGDHAVIANYRDSYPDDAKSISLNNWHEFEQANPDTFENMYQFWVRKK